MVKNASATFSDSENLGKFRQEMRVIAVQEKKSSSQFIKNKITDSKEFMEYRLCMSVNSAWKI
ncbi:hypothetical protein I4U23_005688 [Adineta vaga]|nr:hypothetical protein I4U23_005688 [Adineta vaga]